MQAVRLVAVAILFAALATSPAGAGEPPQATGSLQLGSPMTGRTSDAQPAVFAFEAESGGLLTVVVRGMSGTDLILAVTDDLGQPLADARSDQDIGGDTGAEQLMAAVTTPGLYHVRVETWSGSGDFEIAASWIAMASMETPSDPDGRPTAATALVPGTPITDALDPGTGDNWDWYVVSVDAAAVITVITDAPEGDLKLEAFMEDAYGEAVQQSDQDAGGVAGNESISIRAEAGQKIYFKVSPVFSFGDAIPYTIRAGTM